MPRKPKAATETVNVNERQMDDLRDHRSNPRQATDKRIAALKKAMRQFGDLGGIIRNQDGQLIGGHQRVRAFRDHKGAKVVVERTYDPPTKAGTTAEGYVSIDGERFAYRETAWTDQQAKAAMLAANRQAGEWSMTELTSIINELSDSSFDMELTMFDTAELDAYLPDAGDLARLGDEEEEVAPARVRGASDAPDVEHPTGTQSQPPAGPDFSQAPTNHVKLVQLFYLPTDHGKFGELTDALKEAYGKDNLSDTVLEAIKRASIRQVL